MPIRPELFNVRYTQVDAAARSKDLERYIQRHKVSIKRITEQMGKVVDAIWDLKNRYNEIKADRNRKPDESELKKIKGKIDRLQKCIIEERPQAVLAEKYRMLKDAQESLDRLQELYPTQEAVSFTSP